MIKLLKKPKKLLTLLAIVVGLTLSLSGLQSAIIDVSAVLHPIMFVAPDEMEFGLSFPQEVRTAEFVVVGKWSYPEEINYQIEQDYKPIWPEPAECEQNFDFVEEAREYCQINPEDYDCCYPSICPYLYKISEEDEGDTHNHARLNPVGGEDLVDYWLVEFHVPTIRGYVDQTYVGEPIEFPGLYGCDIKVTMAEGTYCGDGIKQSPNDYGTGGPNNDGYEDCDGSDGVTEGYRCTPDCVLEELPPEPECQTGQQQSCDTGRLGICAEGTQICDGDGFWGECVADNIPVVETCDDGLDNDCDGLVDCFDPDCSQDPACGPSTDCTPQDTQACDTGEFGVCAAGTETCDQYGYWGGCVQDEQSTSEICTDGLDNDCDDYLDCNDIDCYQDPACSSGGTYCGDDAVQSPNDAGTGGPNNDGYEECDGEAGVPEGYYCTPTCLLEVVGPECNIDADCEEGQICYENECYDPQCTDGDQDGYDAYNEILCATGDDCNDGNGAINPGATEICDDIDNNCDGNVDEGEVCGTNGPYCGDGSCNGDESCSTCSLDCGSCGGGGGGGGGGTSYLYLYNEALSAEVVNDTVSVTITWYTNRNATSRVIYDTESHADLGSPPNYGYQWSTPTTDESPKVLFHSVTIDGLTLGTMYYFRPLSAASPDTLGPELTLPMVIEPEEPEEEPEEEPPEPEEETETPPVSPPTTGGTVAGVEYEEEGEGTPMAEVIEEATAETDGDELVILEQGSESEVEVETSCATYIWLLLVLNVIAAIILWFRGKTSQKAIIKHSWLIQALLVVVPAVIGYAQCWLVTWLSLIFILAVIYLIILITSSATKRGKNQPPLTPGQ